MLTVAVEVHLVGRWKYKEMVLVAVSSLKNFALPNVLRNST